MAAKSQTRPAEFISPASGTTYTYDPFLVTSTSVGEVEKTVAPGLASRQPGVSKKVIARAVFNYLRFQRSRGKIVVGADEVARALSLSVSEVEKAAAELASHGVKLEA